MDGDDTRLAEDLHDHVYRQGKDTKVFFETRGMPVDRYALGIMDKALQLGRIQLAHEQEHEEAYQAANPPELEDDYFSELDAEESEEADAEAEPQEPQEPQVASIADRILGWFGLQCKVK